MNIRGWMIDAARLVEKPEYYHLLIENAAHWGINTILVRLTDDQGCAMRFKSHPELITHTNALTPETVRKMIQFADSKGIMLIPEVETFGHTSFVSAVPEHHELQDQDPVHGNAVFTGVIPVHPKTLPIMKDLLEEVAELFNAPYIHAGCDEVNWGTSEMSQQAIKKHGKTQVWITYVNQINEIIRGLGKTTIIWGDHVLRHGVNDEMFAGLDTSILLHDWNYWDYEPYVIQQRTNRAIEAGFSMIGGPAWYWGRWGAHPGMEQSININAFVEAYKQIEHDQNLGVIVTNWLPTRYMTRTLWNGCFYAAFAMNQGGVLAGKHAFQQFVEQHYGAAYNETWADLFNSLLSIMPERKGGQQNWQRAKLVAPWRSEDDLREVLKKRQPEYVPFNRLLQQGIACIGSIRKNDADFQAFLLTLEYLDHLYWRRNVLIESWETIHRNPTGALSLFEIIAHRDQRLHDLIANQWNEFRFESDPAKTESQLFMEPKDQLLASLHQATTFSKKLLQKASILEALIKEVDV